MSFENILINDQQVSDWKPSGIKNSVSTRTLIPSWSSSHGGEVLYDELTQFHWRRCPLNSELFLFCSHRKGLSSLSQRRMFQIFKCSFFNREKKGQRLYRIHPSSKILRVIIFFFLEMIFFYIFILKTPTYVKRTHRKLENFILITAFLFF